eukprot:5758856-Pleurochrysis_carterae.AAC.1
MTIRSFRLGRACHVHRAIRALRQPCTSVNKVSRVNGGDAARTRLVDGCLAGAVVGDSCGGQGCGGGAGGGGDRVAAGSGRASEGARGGQGVEQPLQR